MAVVTIYLVVQLFELPQVFTCGNFSHFSRKTKFEENWVLAGVQPQLIQGIRRRDGVGEGQETTA